MVDGSSAVWFGAANFVVLEVADDGVELTISIESTVTVAGCASCGTRARAKDRRWVRLRDAGRLRYVYRAVDQHGQIIDVYVSARRDTRAARWFFETALRAHGEPVEVVTDRAPALRAVLDELLPRHLAQH